MAEVELSNVINLPDSSNACVNCSLSKIDGHIQESNGNFHAYFNKSLKQDATNSGGQALPYDGKYLPHADSSPSSSELGFSLNLLNRHARSGLKAGQPSINDQFDRLNQSISILPNELTLASNNNSLSEDIDEVLTDDLLQTIDVLTHNELDLNSLTGLTEQLGVTATRIQENPTLDDLIVPITTFSNKTNQGNLISTTQNQFSQLSSTLANQTAGLDVSSKNNLSSLDKYLGSINSVNTSDDSIQEANLQSQNDKVILNEKLQEFLAKSLSDSDIFENLIKQKSIGSERINYSLNLIKTEASLTNNSITANIDTYANLTANSLYNRIPETPIPISVKQGASLEQIQKDVDQSIDQNIRWLINNKIQNAKINIFPESLGQVNIALNIEDTNLKINFIASSSATKELIESGIINLRTQFQESGINLQEVNVQTQFSSQNENGSQFTDLESQNNGVFDLATSNINAEEIPIIKNTSVNMHLLDAYA